MAQLRRSDGEGSRETVRLQFGHEEDDLKDDASRSEEEGKCGADNGGSVVVEWD